MTELIEKEKQHDRQSATASEPTGSPHRDEPMDVDAPASPSSSPSQPPPPPPSSTTNADGDGASSRGLPFPGTVVDGTHAVVHYDLKNLSKATLRDLCDGFHLAKTGNKATLTDRLKKFSADRREWDGLLPGARNRHRGPRDPGVTKGGVAKPPKKKGTTKQSALRRELLFSDDAGSTTSQPFLPTERSKDMRTREEKAAVLSWAREFVARKKRGGRGGPPHPAPAPSPPPSQPYVSRDATAPVRGDAGVSEGPPMAVQNAALAERIQQIQAELAALMAVVVAPSSSAAAAASASSSSSPASASSASSVVAAPAPALATDGAPPSTATPPQATASHERPSTLAASDPGPLPVEYLKLANGVLSFSKQSVPDPPSISFAKDIPRLIKMWDDGSPEWSPSEAVLRVQGVPIALKHWPVLYRYGKSGQWAGTKKNWAHWRDIATSWQELTEKGFWLKFSIDHQPMSYTAICEVLKEERAAANRRLAQQAKDEYGDGFSSVFEYRRGSDHLVKNKQSAIARQYRSLQMAG
ncbi:hypothetical protein EDB85DRAFT_2145603 [Lactarius pseudohatsudake]|nr:hypothetical protein EDB85DRAFT_2145603 [Lactarius pseudohatsudake]